MLQKVELKQRIIGGIVLISLAAILVPFLMDDPRQEVRLLESNVPAWPDNLPLTTIEINEEGFSPAPQPVASSRPTTAADSSTVTKPIVDLSTAAAPSTAITPDTPAAESADGRYEVQVVSYSVKSRKRAERFLQRMESKGYQVKLDEGTRKGKRSLRITTQPLPSMKTAREMKRKIDLDFKADKVKSMIRSLK